MNKTLSRLIIALLFLAPSFAGASELRWTANMGYDLISQEFFADSLLLSGADSNAVQWQLQKDYLDDLRASFSLQYFPFSDQRLELRSSYEQSQDFLRTRLNSNLRLPMGRSRLDLVSELELKHRHRGDANSGDNYLLGNFRTRFTTPLTASTRGWVQLRGDFVEFDSTSEYVYNYNRIGAAVGLSRMLGDFTFADADLFVNSSSVPDSSWLDYQSFGLTTSIVKIGTRGSFDFYFRAENRNYNQPGNEDDHQRYYLQLRHKYELSDKFYTKQDGSFESLNYDPADLTNFSYNSFKAEVLLGLTFGNAEVGLGPAMGILSGGSSEMGQSQEYEEYSLKAELDYLRVGGLFGSLESFIGKRSYELNSEFQSDFTFERVSLIGNLTISRAITYSLLYSAEWEWHGSEFDNSRIDLISTSISYVF